MVMGWAGLLLFIGSWVRALGGGMTGLGWAGLVCGFVGSWVALGFVWVSFPRATSEGFSFSKLIAGVETRFPRTYRSSIRSIDSYILRSDFRDKCRKTMYFYQVFQLFHCKWLSFLPAKGRRGYAKRSKRSSRVRGRSFFDFLQVHEGSGKWVTQ